MNAVSPLVQVPLLLASASPARYDTLRAAGIDPQVQVSEVNEPAMLEAATERYGALAPVDVALLLARAKAEDVASRCTEQTLVLGCDSVLELDGVAYGKPGSAEVARERWEQMTGKTGVLHSGHWIVDLRDEGGTGATMGAVGSTTVTFAQLDDEEIDSYVATGEPIGVAGAFTIDGLGGAYVDHIDGDHHNVVGVSLPLLRKLLSDIGIPWRALRSTTAG